MYITAYIANSTFPMYDLPCLQEKIQHVEMKATYVVACACWTVQSCSLLFNILTSLKDFFPLMTSLTSISVFLIDYFMHQLVQFIECGSTFVVVVYEVLPLLILFSLFLLLFERSNLHSLSWNLEQPLHSRTNDKTTASTRLRFLPVFASS